ncbi:MAG: hypothetical protein MZW92_68030 [Comamonadaceae bacterium]|nr:hypothetical protein [Comamonadaceae bacterium]
MKATPGHSPWREPKPKEDCAAGRPAIAALRAEGLKQRYRSDGRGSVPRQRTAHHAASCSRTRMRRTFSCPAPRARVARIRQDFDATRCPDPGPRECDPGAWSDTAAEALKAAQAAMNALTEHRRRVEARAARARPV